MLNKDEFRLEQGLRSLRDSQMPGASLRQEQLRVDKKNAAIGIATHKKIMNQLANGRTGKLLKQALREVSEASDYIGHRYTTNTSLIDGEDQGVVLFKTPVLERGTGDVLGEIEYVMFRRDLPEKFANQGNRVEYFREEPGNVVTYFIPQASDKRPHDYKRIHEIGMLGTSAVVIGNERHSQLTFAERGVDSVLVDFNTQLANVLADVAARVDAYAKLEQKDLRLLQLKLKDANKRAA
ncbi:MAG: hypothetical protein R3A13_04990 [Bdellovibrionota bacterium]